MAIPEREFFRERTEQRAMQLTCPRCRHRADYQVRWVRRVRKDRLPAGADERDRALFAKLRDYLLRLDDEVVCARCRRRFEIPSQHSLVFL
jgi:DNA-directed RNA polymerase subunit RPC12/RpoP